MGVPVRVRPINQVNASGGTFGRVLPGRHSGLAGPRSTDGLCWCWPDQPAVSSALVYGADLQMPLNDFARYGEANFITPASSGTVDAFWASYLSRRRARHALQKRFAPLLQTAGNTSFAVDLPR